MLSESLIPNNNTLQGAAHHRQTDPFEQTAVVQQVVNTFSPNNMTTNLPHGLLFGSTLGNSGNLDLPLAQTVNNNPYQDTLPRGPSSHTIMQHEHHALSQHTTQDAYYRVRQLEGELL
jgi:hypothetical protein